MLLFNIASSQRRNIIKHYKYTLLISNGLSPRWVTHEQTQPTS